MTHPRFPVRDALAKRKLKVPMTDNTTDQSETPETPGERSARGEAISSFSTFLAGHMVAAVTDTPLSWQDAVYAAALAIRMMGTIATKLDSKHQRRTVPPEEAEKAIDEMLARARSVKVVLTECGSLEEFEAVTEAMDSKPPAHH
jgi:hypothetical protein